MRRVGVRGPEPPCAAAGEVGPDPFPIRRGALCADLNGPGRLLAVGDHGQLVNPVEWEGALPQFGLSVGVAEHFGGVRAHWALHWALFG